VPRASAFARACRRDRLRDERAGAVAEAGARRARPGGAGADRRPPRLFRAHLRRKLSEEETDLEQALISRAEVGKSRDELARYRRDLRSWTERLDQLPHDRGRELAAAARRYADPQPHRFPVAVVFGVPRLEAVR
jgi:hypothetical protein